MFSFAVLLQISANYEIFGGVAVSAAVLKRLVLKADPIRLVKGLSRIVFTTEEMATTCVAEERERGEWEGSL